MERYHRAKVPVHGRATNFMTAIRLAMMPKCRPPSGRAYLLGSPSTFMSAWRNVETLDSRGKTGQKVPTRCGHTSHRSCRAGSIILPRSFQFALCFMSKKTSIQKRTPGSLHPAGSAPLLHGYWILGLWSLNAAIACLNENWLAAWNALCVCWFIFAYEKMYRIRMQQNVPDERPPQL